jgi:hypothetical protein
MRAGLARSGLGSACAVVFWSLSRSSHFLLIMDMSMSTERFREVGGSGLWQCLFHRMGAEFGACLGSGADG